jgi:hypothetical protein
MLRCATLTTCRGRVEHLRETLPRNRAHWGRLDWSTFVVDWGESEGLAEFCAEHGAEVLDARELGEDTGSWRKSSALNLGFAELGRRGFDVVQQLDADMVAQWAPGPVLDLGPGHWCRSTHECMAGWVVAWTTDLAKAGELPPFNGWGAEDWALRALLHVKAGAHCVLVSPALDVIPHADAVRTRYQDESIGLSSARNSLRANALLSQWCTERGRALTALERAALWEPGASERGLAELDDCKQRAAERGFQVIP